MHTMDPTDQSEGGITHPYSPWLSWWWISLIHSGVYWLDWCDESVLHSYFKNVVVIDQARCFSFKGLLVWDEFAWLKDTLTNDNFE